LGVEFWISSGYRGPWSFRPVAPDQVSLAEDIHSALGIRTDMQEAGAVETPRDQAENRLRNERLTALVARVSAGEDAGLGELYDATNRLIYSLVLRIVSDAATADEVTLDVYKQVWRQASRYDASRGGPLAWLTTIARSRALDRLRADRQELLREEPLETAFQHAASDDVEGDAAAAETRAIVQRALSELSPEQRRVLELAYYGGLSQSEIAAKLNQPLGTVKTRTRLGMIKLRDLLQSTFEGAR
jgi:RNA polymerase sigma-70 factor (ECF subfamily)